jgi:hypothetical protein
MVFLMSISVLMTLEANDLNGINLKPILFNIGFFDR